MSWNKNLFNDDFFKQDPCNGIGDPVLAAFLSFLICVLSIIIEAFAHTIFPESISHHTAQSNARTPSSTLTPANLRAKRFAIVSVLSIPLIVAFSYRVAKGGIPGCPYPHDEEDWWLLILFAIIPFSNAMCAWLRTLVDCVVMRFGMTLQCPLTRSGGLRKNGLGSWTQKGVVWWPVFGILGAGVVGVVYFASVIAGIAMGRDGRGREEGDAEEGVELIDNDDRGEEESELPPYTVLQEARECSK
ncbi:unnamed protein product [Periconia digitata]|uniref:Uncharacterized protein n=1 Tax=Periconia digitata TaxID=1303443 RepID=A0A9W4UGC7_9PLEO|nr:unnamed protein product [Periconia digitata]